MALSLARVLQPVFRPVRYDAELLRPPAKGPLLTSLRRRDSAPLAGAIGLSPEQMARLAVWGDDVQVLTGPGLICETFACGGHDWGQILAKGELERVTGAFALARQSTDRLDLIRDAVGERTLFYASVGEGLIYASTLDLLLAPGLIRPRLDPEVVARYLSYAYVPGRETLLQGVCELEPGEWLSWESGKIARRSWWQPSSQVWEPQEKLPELASELRERLEDAVRLRMPADGPICASLSGGVDSSLVVALLRRFHAGELITFTVSFGPQYRNELPFSQCVADHCRTRHHILEARPRTVMHHFDQTIALMGNPIGDPLTVPNALIYREASRYSGVLFNGEGGDPNFGGPKNIPMILSQLYGDPYHERLGETTYLRERTYLRSYRKLYEDLPQLLSRSTLDALPPDCLEKQLAPWMDPENGDSLVQKLMAINAHFKGAHHILFKVNALSRAFGIQPASPLFDKAVTELAFASAPQLKLRGTVEKFILKQAVADLLPERIIHRPKSGMQVPVELWFRPGGPLHREARKRMRRLEDHDLFNPDYLRTLMRWELPGFLPRHGAKVWILLTLEAWIRKYV